MSESRDELLAEMRAMRKELAELRREQACSSSPTVPISVAMALLGCRRSKVFELLAENKLVRAGKVGRERMITRASLDAFLARSVPAVREPVRGRQPRAARPRIDAQAAAAAIRALR